LVTLLVELPEQEEEHHGVQADPPDECFWIIALDEEQLEGVNHDGDELQHLESGQVLLPPEEWLHLWTHRCQKIIHVHHDVDEGVQ